jgi:hypothetical protein
MSATALSTIAKVRREWILVIGPRSETCVLSAYNASKLARLVSGLRSAIGVSLMLRDFRRERSASGFRFEIWVLLMSRVSSLSSVLRHENSR